MVKFQSNKEVMDEKSSIIENAMLNAMAFMAITGDRKDEITEQQAFKRYGKTWVKDRTSRGWIHYIKTGAFKTSAKTFSVFEIECQKRAEKNIDEYYNRLTTQCQEMKQNL